MFLATAEPEFWFGVAALVTAIVTAIGVLVRMGPEREKQIADTTVSNAQAQGTLVSAQDVVIENLRVELKRQRDEFEWQFTALRARHKAEIDQLKVLMAEEAETCEERITQLQIRLEQVESRNTPEEGVT